MKKRILTTILASLIATSGSFALDTSTDILQKGDFTYYKVKSVIADAKGIVSWNELSREIEINVNGVEYSYSIDAKILKSNSKLIDLAAVPINENGSLFATESFFGKIGISISKNNVSIAVSKTDSNALSQTYAFGDLLKIAMDNNLTLKKTEADLERTDIVNEDVSDIAELVIGQGNGLSDLTRRSATANFHMSQIYLDIAKHELPAQKEAVENKLRSQYETLLLDVKKLELLNVSKNVSDMELKQYSAKRALGLVSEMDYQTKVLANKSLAETLKSQSVAISNDYVAINNTINKDIGKNYSLSDDIVYKPMERELNPVYQAAYANDMSPVIYKLRKSIEMSKLGVDLYTYNAGSDPLSAKILDVKKAELVLADTQATYAKIVSDLAGQLQALQQNREVLNNNLAKAQQDALKAETTFKLGMVTELEYRTAVMAVQDAEVKLYENDIKYTAALRLYEKPWLATQ